MKNNKLYFYFWSVSVFFIVLSIYWQNSIDAVIDLNFHDIYYVIHNSDISKLLVVVYALFGFIYLIFHLKKTESNHLLTKIHSLITLAIVPIYFIGYYIIEMKEPSEFPLFDDDTSKLNGFTISILTVFIISQFILILNVFISLAWLFFKKNSSNFKNY